MKTHLILFGILLFSVAACAPSNSAELVALVQAHEKAHNAGNVDAIVALYADDAVEVNGMGTHQGHAKLKAVYTSAVNTFKVEYKNIRVEGNKVFYDAVLTVTSDAGRKVGEKYEAEVENGKFKTMIRVGRFTP